jgi:hypothetical protein
MAQTPEVYYLDDDLYGKYQYVALSQIVLDLEQSAQEDGNFLSGTKRSKILKSAKQALRDLTETVANDELSFEITVPDGLVWALPQDYVSSLSIYVVKRDSNTGNFTLFPLDLNPDMIKSIGYLQDNEAEILFDNDGNILEADSSNAINHSFTHIPNSTSRFGNKPTKDTSKNSKYGGYVVDERRGIIIFTSNLADNEVVIKYKSDGLQAELDNGEVYLHKLMSNALREFTYYLCIRDKRPTLVPANEKYRAKQEYLSTRHKAVLNMSGISLMKISKAMNVSTKIF